MIAIMDSVDCVDVGCSAAEEAEKSCDSENVAAAAAAAAARRRRSGSASGWW